MTRFLQLHFLTVYPPSNPNRDDQGRPKTARFGNAVRLRLSSQSIKRAVRQSDAMQRELAGHLGHRTQRLGEELVRFLVAKGANEKQAQEIATKVADAFGKIDEKAGKEGKVRTLQLAFISPEERKHAEELAGAALKGEKIPEADNLSSLLLRKADGAADIAMFGRMLADDAEYNREAAVQISHAITTHQAQVEDDFYTAVDDLKTKSEDAGAGFVGDAGFGSGVYYLYACVDCDLLIENLAGDKELAGKAMAALVEALATSAPSGKQASFAHRPRAGYIRAECGIQQPRSLAGAFFRPITGSDLMTSSIKALEDEADSMDQAYGLSYDAMKLMNVGARVGSLESVKTLAADYARNA